MADRIQTAIGKPYPLGATIERDGSINFAVVLNQNISCGILLYNKKAGREGISFTEEKLAFTQSNRIGNIYCMKVAGIDPQQYEYNFYSDEKIITDPYAKVVVGNEKWGNEPEGLRGGFLIEDFDWKNDRQLMTEYEDTVLYLLHVRGFTKHVSSKVKEKGTFTGIIEKIPYLKDLGITAIEMMPAYEFMEFEKVKEDTGINIAYSYNNTEPKLNYWGYKEGFYFAPKYAYCGKSYGNQYYNAFKQMVYELHQNGIEVIMQFYFPDFIKQAYILEVLKFWIYEYHIDGIHLMGNKIPTALLGTEPMLANIKMFYYDFPLDEIYSSKEVPDYRNLAICGDEFMYDMRKFLKSDEGMMGKVLHHFKYIPKKTGLVHYVTHGNGFTLADVVSYDRKHNEANGENNMDGTPYNCTWNCGVEGKTSKKSIVQLRLKQMKNAEILNILSAGTPLLVSGDEFVNSQGGNNNPYCIDNSTTWLNWNDVGKQQEFHDFVRSLITFYKEQPVFHQKKEAMMTDYLECGFPDVSYHGEEPWKLQYDNLTRHFAILYCGEYANVGSDNEKEKHPDIYLGVNMHWTSHEFVLPRLRGKKWYQVVNTQEAISFSDKPKLIKNQKKITIEERSIVILIGE